MNTSSKGKLTICMIDSDPEPLGYYKHKIELLFRDLGYIPDIHGMSGKYSGDGSDFFHRRDLFDNEYFDVFICDVSLAGGSDQLGLQVLSSVKRKYPGIYTIAYSREQPRYLECVEFGRVDLFISKQQLEGAAHRQFLHRMISRGLKINTGAFISTDLCSLDSRFSRLHQIELNRAVRKITFTGDIRLKNESVAEVSLKKLPSGYSGSYVYEMVARTSTGFNCVQAVLKLAFREDKAAADALKRELANYQTYVRWYLPYHWRPELIGEVDEGSFKVICYAFVSSGDAPI